MSSNTNAILLNQVFSLLARKIVVPTEFHNQVASVKEMLKDDVTGLIDSLTDFAVDSATVDFTIETENDKFSKILKTWINTLNIGYKGKIPIGIKPLAKEYMKERWKASSFPVLKIAKWDTIDGIQLPTQMYFVDGGSIYAFDKDEKNCQLELLNYNYYLGNNKKCKLDADTIFAKTNGRWFDKYPTPFLIKRGIYHNYKIISSLKDKQTTILDQIIPYLLLIKKGTEGLAKENIKTYSNEELKATIKEFQDLMNEMKLGNNVNNSNIKAPVRAVNFDEEIQDRIPKIDTMFDSKLFAVAEKNILTGLGFVDVIEAVSTSRRESILNPKVFIGEVKTGVEDFKQILKELLLLIMEQNKKLHKKYVNSQIYISSSPVKAFMTDDFKDKIRQLYDRGRISSQTAIELIGEVDFETEVYRVKKETKRNINEIMYPPITKNQEGQGKDFPGEEVDEDNLPEDKKGIEKQNYDLSIIMKKDLEIAPYQTIKELPEEVKKLPRTKQIKWRKVFNNSYYYKLGITGNKEQAETYAFKIAWNSVKVKKRAK